MLQIAPELVQHYVLDVEPRAVDDVVARVELSATKMAGLVAGIGAWKYYAWLERPAIWVIRPVQITTGLDLFLIENGGLPGVIDVAELLNHVVVDASVPGHLSNSWNEFMDAVPHGGVFFASFLWLNWESLFAEACWNEGVAPPKSEILAATRRVLGERAAALAARLDHPLRLLLVGTPGDCDLILYGITQTTADVDSCLFLINQLTCDSLAPCLGRTTPHAAVPLILRSRTELAVELEMYQKVQASGGRDTDVIDAINGQVGTNLIPEIALNRGGGSITTVHDSIGAAIGPEWADQPVFGRDDFVVRLASRAAFCGMGDLLAVLARLDEATIKNPSFPSRSSLRLGFTSPVGRVEGVPVEPSPAVSPPALPSAPLDEAVLDAMTAFIRSLSTLHWREDLRIIERVAERCVTLQKAHMLPRETRGMLSTAFQRFGEICRFIRTLEERLEVYGDVPVAGMDEKTKRQYSRIREEIVLLRCELHHAGASLDRVLTHHSRGVIALLLHPASQARGPTHFTSEIALSAGLGIFFRSPAMRLHDLVVQGIYPERSAKWSQQLAERVRRISRPIIYASHEPDFSIRPGLTLLRIPTWGLWMPTTHILHEFAHALAVVGALHYLARKTLSRIGGGPVCPCPFFEESLKSFGLDVAQPGDWTEDSALARFARDDYFRSIRRPTEGLSIAYPYQQHMLEEITADAVERLLGYESSESGDRMHLWNCLPSIAPSAVRMEPRQIRDRICRLFAGQLAVKLAFAVRRTGLPLLARDQAATVNEMAKAHAALFSNWLKMWFDGFLNSDEINALPLAGRQMMRDLYQSCAEFLQSGASPQVYFAQLLAVILALEPVTKTEIQSLFKSTLVWGSLLQLAADADAQSANTARLAEHIARGQVPGENDAYPERLVAAVTESFRQGASSTLPPHSRVALSHYFTNLCGS